MGYFVVTDPLTITIKGSVVILVEVLISDKKPVVNPFVEEHDPLTIITEISMPAVTVLTAIFLVLHHDTFLMPMTLSHLMITGESSTNYLVTDYCITHLDLDFLVI